MVLTCWEQSVSVVKDGDTAVTPDALDAKLDIIDG